MGDPVISDADAAAHFMEFLTVGGVGRGLMRSGLSMTLVADRLRSMIEFGDDATALRAIEFVDKKLGQVAVQNGLMRVIESRLTLMGHTPNGMGGSGPAQLSQTVRQETLIASESRQRTERLLAATLVGTPIPMETTHVEHDETAD